MKKKFVIIFLLFVFMTANRLSVAETLNAGGSAAAFLKNPIGARGIGLGGAFTALVDDGSAVFWNPAGLVNNTQREVLIDYSIDSFSGLQSDHMGRTYSMVSYSDPKILANRGLGIAISALYHQIDEIQRTDIFQGSIVRGDMFASTDLVLYLTLNKRMFVDLVAGGISVKVINSTLDDQSSFAGGVDVGTIIDISELFNHKNQPLLWLLWDVNLGFIGRTYTQRTWSDGPSESIPSNADLGVSFKVLKTAAYSLTLASTLSKVQNEPMNVRSGIEFSLDELGANIERFALRGGFGNLYIGVDEERINDNKFFSAGFGIVHKFVRLDYAFTKNTLRDAQLISLGLRF